MEKLKKRVELIAGRACDDTLDEDEFVQLMLKVLNSLTLACVATVILMACSQEPHEVLSCKIDTSPSCVTGDESLISPSYNAAATKQESGTVPPCIPGRAIVGCDHAVVLPITANVLPIIKLDVQGRVICSPDSDVVEEPVGDVLPNGKVVTPHSLVRIDQQGRAICAPRTP